MFVRLKDGMNYLSYALYAFGALGFEAVLAYGFEPVLYGCQMDDWNSWQKVCHWIMTCVVWGLMTFFICKSSEKRYSVNLFQKAEKIRPGQWLCIIIGVWLCLLSTWIDWGGSKVISEFRKRGPLLFSFQYVYYLFEVALVLMIIVFGQIALEKWFGNDRIPYDGIVVALTWGLGHWMTKGSLFAGIYTALGGFVFGSVYLLTNRNIKLSYFY